MPKSPLSVLIALGKGGPKSRNPEGMTSTSETEPDQGGDMSDSMDESESPDESMGEDENCITLPAGFKLPSGDKNGVVTTTLRGRVVGNKLYPEEIGGMSVKGEANETMDDEMAENPEEQANEADAGTEMQPDEAKMAMAYKKKKGDEMAAKRAFSGGGY